MVRSVILALATLVLGGTAAFGQNGLLSANPARELMKSSLNDEIFLSFEKIFSEEILPTISEKDRKLINPHLRLVPVWNAGDDWHISAVMWSFIYSHGLSPLFSYRQDILSQMVEKPAPEAELEDLEDLNKCSFYFSSFSKLDPSYARKQFDGKLDPNQTAAFLELYSFQGLSNSANEIGTASLTEVLQFAFAKSNPDYSDVRFTKVKEMILEIAKDKTVYFREKKIFTSGGILTYSILPVARKDLGVKSSVVASSTSEAIFSINVIADQLLGMDTQELLGMLGMGGLNETLFIVVKSSESQKASQQLRWVLDNCE